MPTITKNKSIVRPLKYTWISSAGVIRENGVINNRPVGRSYDSRTDNPRRKKPKGWLPPRSYSRVVKEGCTLGYMAFYATGVRSDNEKFSESGTCDYSRASEIDLPGFPGDLSSKAVLAARLKLKDQKVDLSVAFAERKQTADLFSSVTKRAAAFYEAIRHRDLKKAKRALGLKPKITRKERKILKSMPPRPPGGRDSSSVAANLYLENAYGLQPLLQDVSGAASALAQNDLEDAQRYTTAVKATRSQKNSYDDVANGLTDKYSIPYLERTLTVSFHSAFVRLDFFLEQPMLAKASSLGLTNPLQTGWEKIPFSFIADWLYPIGDYISSLDSGVGYTFKDGSLSELSRFSVQYYASSRKPSGWKSTSCGGSGKCVMTRLVRTPYTSVPIPGLIGLKNPFSGSHVTSAMALLRQAVRD